MNTAAISHLYDLHVLPVYAPKIALVRGSGSRVWDADGKEYLDFTSGISVCNLGHCPEPVTAAVSAQAAQLVHVSNLFYNQPQAELAERLSTLSNGYKFFFANSGAEANEGLIKFARKWGNPQGKNQIIAMQHSFHGRTLGTLAATDKPAIREGFEPAMTGFSFVPFNDLQAVRDAITPETAAVLLEPVQAEGGVYPADQAYLTALRELCDKCGILLLCDEVQTGIGRCGAMFAHQLYGIQPDAFSLATALGNGYPIGGFGVRPDWLDVLGVGSHATTFGGTPLACAAAGAVLDTIRDQNILANCIQAAQYLAEQLTQLTANSPSWHDVRHLGLLIGLPCDHAVSSVVAAAAKRGLLVLSAGANVLRLLPPLTVTSGEIDQAVAILADSLAEAQA